MPGTSNCRTTATTVGGVRGPTVPHPGGCFDWSSRWQHDADGSREEELRRSIVTETYNGYCVKCKEKRDFEGRVEVSKTGMKMAKGSCPVCGTTVNRILGKA